MATLKEFEDALRQHGMVNALAILEGLKKRDREKRTIAPARRVVGRKMTADLARTILDLHATTGMTQQEIAFKLGVNQGRVNEVIKRGKWLNADPSAPEARSRDKAMDRLSQRARSRRAEAAVPVPAAGPVRRDAGPSGIAARPVSRPARPAAAAIPRDRVLPLLDVRPITDATKPDKGPPRRLVEAPSPIVSAQLAFLDL